MKPFIEWFTLFLVTIVLFGWLQCGVCWIFCENVVGQRYFWSVMGIPMTFNMCFSFMWASAEWAKQDQEAAEKLKKLKTRRGF
jgi:hypothetical protein